MSARFGEQRPLFAFRPGERDQIAAELGVHPNTLSGYLTGSRFPVPYKKARQLMLMPRVASYGFALEDFIGDIPRTIRVWSDADARTELQEAA